MEIIEQALPNWGYRIVATLTAFRPNGAAIDLNHGLLIFGSLLSSKPKDVLELGIGTGFITDLLLQGIEYNRLGSLTCVDNLWDLGGNMPRETLELIKNSKARVIEPMPEKTFVYNEPENRYDFLVSDADHEHAGEWTDQIYRIMRPDAFMFFHDTNNSGYPNLRNYITSAQTLNKPHHLFTVSTRHDEDCNRGLLMIINKK
jgi:predicted O-methyltransferase YrrM